jgi:putative ABC transport system permease protein
MLYNYFKIAFRNISKSPVFSFINIAGLSLGIMSFLLILQYVSFEKSVNTFHKNSESIHRILFEGKDDYIYDYSAPIIGPIVKQNFGEVFNYCRVADQSFVSGVAKISENGEEKLFNETKVAYTDGNFFELFSFPIEKGNLAQLQESNTVAISTSIEKKYFNEASAIGKTISFNNEFGDNLYRVVAVFQDFPINSDLQYDLVLSIQTLGNPSVIENSSWASLDGTSSFLTTYLLLNETINPSELEGKMNTLKKQLDPESEEKILLQPLKYMHLASSLGDKQVHTGNLGFIYLLSGIAILILVIAWFNYINLSTAAALTRAKEVGLRKVVGANKAQLITQFLGESLLLNFVGLVVALGLVNILQFVFNDLIGKSLNLSILITSQVGLWGSILFFFGSVASGAYTAFVLASFQPAQILKGVFSKSSRGLALRKVLVVFQFSISVLLITATVIMNKQISFMINENLGMNIDQLMVISPSRNGIDSTLTYRRESFKNSLAQADFVATYSGSANVPSNGFNYSTNGITQLNPQPGDEKKGYSIIYVDNLFFPTYEIDFVAGRNFSVTDGSTSNGKIDKVILNERAIAQLGIPTAEAAVGKKLMWNDAEIEVLAVVKDYHHQSLKQAIEPIVFVPQASGSFFTVRLKTQNLQEHIAYLNKAYSEYFPGNSFDYFFVEDNFNKQYQTEEQNRKIFTTASGLAIFISCLGLFGLATFTVQQRAKEIGIRKVMGATVNQLTSQLSKDFLFLVVTAIVVATPIAWWTMKQWLEQFAYRTEITASVFILGGGLVSLIALLTISAQTIRAAKANPVDSLRSE